MDVKLKGWMAENTESANSVGMIIEEIDKECSKINIGGYMIELNIPNDDYAFALSLEQDNDETLMDTLVVLNEKLERLKNNPERVNKVFDNLLQVFEKRNCRKHKKTKQATDEIKEPCLYRLAKDSKLECEKAFLKATESSILQEILPWCTVRLDPKLEKIELQLELKGILSQDNVTRALGFRFDDPLIVHITFSSDQWSAREFCVNNFKDLNVKVRPSSAKTKETMDIISKVLDGQDNKLMAAAIKRSYTFKQYGPDDLVPKFVKGFLDNCEIRSDGLLYSKGEAAESNNIIVALLISLGNRLKTLKNNCVLCDNELPPFSRLWYCEEELCLYSFEDQCLGTSVLQELQKSELMDLELTLAFAATKCWGSRDVFEPYPAYLLKKEERRRRSGFFSSYKEGTYAESSEISNLHERKHLSNKNIELLGELIGSFPPLSVMQQSSHEMELVLKLGMSWLKTNGNSADLSEEEYGENLRLPYKILTYILFTNRLSLHPLHQSCRLNVDKCLYQFAVFYDNDKEKIFKERRNTEGSVFAFHGSSLSNWYSIIRNGLRCLSKTGYMSSGNVYGDGIYFSPEMNCSMGYATPLVLTVKEITKEYSVIAICEILSGEKHSSPPFYVVGSKHEKDVVIRYLIVFDGRPPMTRGFIKEGHIFTESGKDTKDTDLYQHYENLRKQYVEEISNEGMMPKDQLLRLLQKQTS
ncbi:hypothetical protein SUGI_1206480 [Cryptomeria japonica]|nr:hypothetical protein SUGI_1206480 [Cryptomeria japonica]